MRVIVVVGARPNFIKVGPLMPALASAGIDARIAHTGQHYDAAMSDVFFSDLAIPEPAWFLGVGSGTHAVQTSVAMVKLEELLSAERPDALFVVGDVNSTLAGALAAAKLHIPVVHLEAGLRSRDMSMPEEVNRIVTDQLSSMLLTPVIEADANLIAEGRRSLHGRHTVRYGASQHRARDHHHGRGKPTGRSRWPRNRRRALQKRLVAGASGRSRSAGTTRCQRVWQRRSSAVCYRLQGTCRGESEGR